jgi:hypothetical protein
MSRKKVKTSTPRHKRLNRSGRLQAAKHWLHTYKGSNVVQGYRKHFGIDLLCAIEELQILGVRLNADYVNQVKQSVECQRKAREKRKQELRKEEHLSIYPDIDEAILFIDNCTRSNIHLGKN